MDFQLRLRKVGWQLYFVPQMIAYHHLAPPERISRTGSTFRFRCRNIKALTHAYARSLGILPGSITFRYFWTGDTGLRALFRKPSTALLSYVVGGYLGKCLGILRWIFHSVTPTPRLQSRKPQVERTATTPTSPAAISSSGPKPERFSLKV
jgi:GT2 family glycosyltransferase